MACTECKETGHNKRGCQNIGKQKFIEHWSGKWDRINQELADLVQEIDQTKNHVIDPELNQEISESISQNYWQTLALDDYYNLIKTKIDYGLADQCTPLELAVWRYRNYASGFRSPQFLGNALMVWFKSASEKEIESFKALRECAWEQVLAHAQAK
jgi:hypothetical protein